MFLPNSFTGACSRCRNMQKGVLHTWHSPSESETSTIISISTQEPNGICAAPNALRVCAPRSPKTSRKSSEAPIGDLVRFDKVGSAVHQYQQPDDTFHPIQVVQGSVQCREEFDGDITRCLPALRRCDF